MEKWQEEANLIRSTSKKKGEDERKATLLEQWTKLIEKLERAQELQAESQRIIPKPPAGKLPKAIRPVV